MQANTRNDAVASPQAMDIDEQLFRAQFDRTAFSLTHHLSDHHLFELPRLLQRQDRPPLEGCDALRFSVGEPLDRIENANTWIILRNSQKCKPSSAIVNQTKSESPPSQVTGLS